MQVRQLFQIWKANDGHNANVHTLISILETKPGTRAVIELIENEFKVVKTGKKYRQA